jgi:hypothetical protein
MEVTSTIAGSGIGTSLEKAWKDIKQNIFLYAGFTVLFGIAYFIVSLIPILGNFTTGLLGFLYSVSIFSASHAFALKGQLEFNDFFGWSNRFSRLLVGNLLYIVIMIFVFIPLIIISLSIIGFAALRGVADDPVSFFQTYGGTLAGIILVFIAIAIVLGIWFFGYFFLIQYTDMRYSECMRVSWKIGRNNFIQLIAFFFLSIGLSMLGALVLLIGLSVTMPLLVATQYHFLRNFVPENSREQEWDMMKDQPSSF